MEVYRGNNPDFEFPRYLAQPVEDVLARKLPWPGCFVGFPSAKDPQWDRDFPGKSPPRLLRDSAPRKFSEKIGCGADQSARKSEFVVAETWFSTLRAEAV